ncbi:OLC1v1015778C1 [Oldenlandia corymbosa var. corymbosa]|uniref:OLC1v1015778C1 n=1 Tax=Oldenlandia corymbosa var. corymbosa TaxID=529605 RepID=A0AAV1E3Z3_OLDCO|nr:OLC1v1015778C1 [Oldenlandia corymbosa var. corymbosa]
MSSGNSDDDTSRMKLVAEKIKGKKKRRAIARESDKGSFLKRSKTHTSPDKEIEETTQTEETIPPATEKEARAEKETGPSTRPSFVKKVKRPTEGNVTILQPRALPPHFTPLTILLPSSALCWKSLLPGLTEADGLKLMTVVMMNHAKRSRDLRRELEEAQAERDPVVTEKWALKERNQQLQAKEAELASGLCKLSIDQLPLWEPLCEALSKMSSPECITSFPGDVAPVFSRGRGEELAIPEVFDEDFGIDLEEDEDETTEEDDTGNSGAKD